MLTQESALRKDKRSAYSDMQHRHFATIAAIIADMDGSGSFESADRLAVAEHFADHLHKTNAKFDKARFLAACNME